jgi:leucyl-tRNA synthetase
VQRVSEDVAAFKLNTAVSALMEFANALEEHQAGSSPGTFDEALQTLLRLLAPFAPHIAEELWQRLGEPYSIHQQPWPTYDPAAIAEATITLVVQVNGKVRDRVEVPADVSEAQAKEAAFASDTVQRHLNGQTPRQVIYVPGRLVNIVL